MNQTLINSLRNIAKLLGIVYLAFSILSIPSFLFSLGYGLTKVAFWAFILFTILVVSSLVKLFRTTTRDVSVVVFSLVIIIGVPLYFIGGTMWQSHQDTVREAQKEERYRTNNLFKKEHCTQIMGTSTPRIDDDIYKCDDGTMR